MNKQNILLLLSILTAIQCASAMRISPGSYIQICRREFYNRTGLKPSRCEGNKENITFSGRFCFENCPSRTKPYSYAQCQQLCPLRGGWKDEGSICTRSVFQRPVYIIYSNNANAITMTQNSLKRCEEVHGIGNCETIEGGYYAPKCDESLGFYAEGCCKCRPKVPDCLALGYDPIPGLNLSCTKKIISLTPKDQICDIGVKSAGLCFKDKCRAGYTAVGPLCLRNQQTPQSKWIECGMHYALDSYSCMFGVNTKSNLINVVFNLTKISSIQVSTVSEKTEKIFKPLKEEFQKLKNIRNSLTSKDQKNLDTYYIELQKAIESGNVDDLTLGFIANNCSKILLGMDSILTGAGFNVCQSGKRKDFLGRIRH